MMLKTRIASSLISIFLYFFTSNSVIAQDENQLRNYQTNRAIIPLKLHVDYTKNTYKDLDNDGDPDILYGILQDGRKCAWVDDNDNMLITDLEGDLIDDCLLIDINNDGDLGGPMDLNIDYIDLDKDKKADIQIIVDNGEKDFHDKWMSHFLVFFDDDKDGNFSYIDWEKLKFEGWDHSGLSNFFADYHGQSKMLKVHITTSDIANLEYNWENPFLWYDLDKDGLSEMAIRVIDEPNKTTSHHTWEFTKKATLIQQSWDIDNDSEPGNPLDFDMSLRYSGSGFDYGDQIHPLPENYSLKDADFLFQDPRWRHLSKFVFPDHKSVTKLTLGRGEWNQCWFVFDEDDDCHRWERVEFYDPKSPFKVGAKNGGLDHNPQADVSGDRGEWDSDFSGKGQLYLSKFDGKIHLFGAEKGYWRIDQFATYFQGWQGWRGPNLQPEDFAREEPKRFATIQYSDTDQNGFFDQMSFDMDGDTLFEDIISLRSLGLSDLAKPIMVTDSKYSKIKGLFYESSNLLWKNALDGLKIAKKWNINTEWYAIFLHPKSLQEKYNYGFWLSYYIYKDLMSFAKNNSALQIDIQKAYFNSSWKDLKSLNPLKQ
ncbi:MAG: hypothetical protein R2774_12405 [Saprospiraceae bacterium]